MNRRVSGVSTNSFDPEAGAGSESFGFAGNPEGFDIRTGGVYGSVPKSETYTGETEYVHVTSISQFSVQTPLYDTLGLGKAEEILDNIGPM